jgi:RimJ/RimL family protein N-acetyltransferase
MSLIFKSVTLDDAELIWNWIIDEAVKSASFSNKDISLSEHREWVKNKINSIDTQLLLVLEDNQALGQIRIDQSSSGTYLSIVLAPQARGRGLGVEILNTAVARIAKDGIKEIFAQIRQDNLRSQKAFERAGFNRIADLEQNQIKGFLYRRLV